jgi:hypothetical protein
MLDQMGRADAARQQLQLALQVDPGYSPAKEFLTELTEVNDGGNPVQLAGFNQPK